MSGTQLVRDPVALRVTPKGLNAGIAVVSSGLLAALAAEVWLQPGGHWRLAALAIVGGMIGAALLRSNFGFASAFRALAQWGDAAGFQAHALMLGLASLLMMPLLELGHVGGVALRGGATPIGVGFAVGGLMFGAGMQIGGGCASGTLFALGGGNAKLIGTLAGFVIGSALGAWSMGFWWSLPTMDSASLQSVIGFGPAMVVQLAVLAGLWVLARRNAKTPVPRALLVGGLVLAVLNAATLVLAGKPWGETSAFALWGSKLFTEIGIDARGWTYWAHPAGTASAIDKATLLDITSVMDAAILLGAILAAALSGVFKPRLGGGLRPWIGALLGGMAMGYGARLANGCNIGAYFSAISVGSLSGWVWMGLALAGSWIGLQLRPLFALDQVRETGPSC
jgi:uncharacterized protein